MPIISTAFSDCKNNAVTTNFRLLKSRSHDTFGKTVQCVPSGRYGFELVENVVFDVFDSYVDGPRKCLETTVKAEESRIGKN